MNVPGKDYLDPKTDGPSKLHESAEQERREQRHRHRMLGAFLNFYLWLPLPLKIVFLMFGMLYSPPMVQNLAACIRAPKLGTLRAISGPEYIFVYVAAIWGLVFCGVDYYLERYELVAPLTWIYLGILLFTLVTMGLDFRSGSWLGVIVLGLAVVAALGWYGERKQIPVLAMVGSALAWFELDVFPRNFVFAFSVAMLAVYLVVYVRMNLVNVLKISGNYVQVWTFASRSPKDTRASFSVVPDYDDINEALLGFACRLNLRSKSPRVQSHEFPNMPGGPVVEQIATHLLNAQEVQVVDESDFEGADDDDS